jgi:hypothetical protein
MVLLLSRDGIFARLGNIVSGGRVGQSKEAYQQERQERREQRAIRPIRVREVSQDDMRQTRRESEALREAREGTQQERREQFKKKWKESREFAAKTSKEIERTTKPLTKPVKAPVALAAAILPRGTIPQRAYKSPEKKTSSGPTHSRPGRPRGALSAGYYIPGKGAVDVREWRKWVAKQRKIKKMTQPEKASRQYESPQQAYQEEYTGEEMAPSIEDAREQVREVQEERVQSQPYPGEQLKREPGVRLATEQSDNILNAPNVMKGEMTKVVSGINEKPIITLPPRPISNPRGEVYAEPEPASGKMVLKRRISEKWMTGEAL